MEDRPSCLQRLKARARALKTELLALYFAARDPRTPWYARALVWFVVAHSLSPIDLIPDFIPVLGYLDDLILIPLGLALALRMIPPVVLAEARERARRSEGRPEGLGGLQGAGMVIVALIWLLFLFLTFKFILAFNH